MRIHRSMVAAALGLVLAATVLVASGPAGVRADGEGVRGTPSKASGALQALLAEYEAHIQSAAAATFQTGMPAVRAAGGNVVIDASASADAGELLSDLQALGLQGGSTFGRVVSGLLPVSAIGELDSLASLRAARPTYATTRAGLVTSEGDAAMRADIARSTFAVDGTGVVIGTLSDSYDCLGGAAADVSSGDLPGGVTVLQELTGCTGGTDEGRGMMQLVHDVAPGATQMFHSASNGMADFAGGIVDLAVAGADVINDDVIYFAEPMFQDGIIAQAVDTVVNTHGVPYFSSAGNNGRAGYEAAYVAGTTPVTGYASAHDFDPGAGEDVLQAFTVPVGGAIVAVLQWDQPFFSAGGAGAASDYDLFLLDGTPSVVASSMQENLLTGDPFEIVSYVNETAGPLALDLVVAEFDAGTPSPFGPYFKIVHFGSVDTPDEWDVASPTIFGHAAAVGARAIGASPYYLTPEFGTSPAVIEPFSSPGPVTVFFDLTGSALAAPDVRNKPEIVGPDGTNTTFFGSDFEPDGNPNFFGTSAAAPHVAAVAALGLEAVPSATTGAIYAALEMTALDMGPVGYDSESGHGLVQADAALSMLTTATVPVPSLTVWGLVAMGLALMAAWAFRARRPRPRADGGA